jgi:spermidine synthase
VRPWTVLARAESAEGPLELRRRGADDFLITLAGRVLMNSRAHRSEAALAAAVCAPLADRRAPRVLVAGLGMGLTLRAALDALPPRARVRVAELSPAVVAWCRGPLAELCGHALADPRVAVHSGDVAEVIAAAAQTGPRLDAIALDLSAGPQGAGDRDHPVYGRAALATAYRALAPGGRLGVWSERPDAAFAKRLRAAGFAVSSERPGRGGLRHAVVLAERGR